MAPDTIWQAAQILRGMIRRAPSNAVGQTSIQCAICLAYVPLSFGDQTRHHLRPRDLRLEML